MFKFTDNSITVNITAPESADRILWTASIVDNGVVYRAHFDWIDCLNTTSRVVIAAVLKSLRVAITQYKYSFRVRLVGECRDLLDLLLEDRTEYLERENLALNQALESVPTDWGTATISVMSGDLPLSVEHFDGHLRTNTPIVGGLYTALHELTIDNGNIGLIINVINGVSRLLDCRVESAEIRYTFISSKRAVLTFNLSVSNAAPVYYQRILHNVEPTRFIYVIASSTHIREITTYRFA